MTKYHFFYIIIIVLLLLFFIFGNKGWIQYRRLIEIQKKYENQTKILLEKTKKLEKEIELLKKDKNYMEMIIKQKTYMKKPNEDLYIIDNESSKRIGN